MNLSTHFSEFFTQFHFLRPLWLIAFLPILALLGYSWRREKTSSDWQSLIKPEFLTYLLDKNSVSVKTSSLGLVGFIWLLCVLALAGPSWNKRPSAIEKNQNALVILLDLSPSMLSQDLRPNRLARAKLKITDLLRERPDGLTALVAYAGDAHLVTPLSDDKNTLLNLLPSLDPTIMPTQGSNTESAIKMAIDLLRNAGAARGTILLMTDGVVPEAFSTIESQIKASPYVLTIYGIGTAQATPITNAQGGFVRDAQGSIVTTQLNAAVLSSLARQVNSYYTSISSDDSDIQSLLRQMESPVIGNQKSMQDSLNQNDFDQWYDEGFWLIFLILPLVLYCFRRGLLSIAIIGNLFIFSTAGFSSSSAEASTLDNIFQTSDQQAQQEFNKGDHASAAQHFQNTEWRAAAEYKAGKYAEAASDYAKIDTPQADYNRGNALAKAEQLEEAIKAYDQALKRNPELSDAKKNRDLVKSLLDQKNQKNNQKNNQDQKDKDQKKDDQNKEDQKTKDQSKDNSSENNQDQKNADQRSSDSGQPNKENSSESKDSQQRKDNQTGQNNSSGQQSSSRQSENQAEQNSHSAQASSAKNNAADQTAQQKSSAAKSSNGDKSNANKHESKKQDADKKQVADPYEEKMTQEQKDAMQQWLRQVPDDPGGLLREKFKWQSIHNQEKQSRQADQDQTKNTQQRW